MHGSQVYNSLKKPYLVNPTPLALAADIIRHRVRVLNVAGNRLSKNPEVVGLTAGTLLATVAILRKADS
jgi:hypothetical protein